MKLNIQKFAITKSTTFKESNVSIENNTSDLKITIEFSPNNSETWFSSKKLSCTCNGKTQSKTVSLSKGGSVKTSFTFSSIKHNADGTKSVSWSWNISTGTSMLGNLSDSGTRTLQTINRYGRVTNVSGNTTNSTITITYHSYNSAYTYDLIILYPDDYINFKTYYDLESSVGEHTINISIENTYFDVYPNSSTASIIYAIETHITEEDLYDDLYNSSINLNSSVVPSVTIGTLTEGNTEVSSLGWGVFVQNKSKLVYDLIGYGTNNSTIVSYNSSAEGKTFSTSHVEVPIISSGQSSVIATSKDSRNRDSSIDVEYYNVYPYSNPTISIAEAQRCRIDGTIDRDGTYVLFSFSGSISPIGNNNDSYFIISYKRSIDESYTDVTLSTSYTYNQTNVVSSFTISPDYEYDIKFTTQDSFTHSEIVRTLDVGFDLLNFNPSGKSMAIGKVSEASANDELLEIALETDFQNNVTINSDPVVTESSLPSISSGSLTITKTTGNSTCTGTYVQLGNIVSVNVSISTTGTTNSGSNIFEGKITSFTPQIGTALVGYVGARAVIASYGTDQVITIRNAGATNISSGSNINIRGTFIV